MKIVVAGGTGFVGRHIARGLLDAGHEVTVLGRDPQKALSMGALRGANATGGDVTDPSSLTGKVAGADALVQAVQFPNHPIEVPKRGLTYDRYDRAGTENLLAEAERAGVGRFFYISGAGADPLSDKTWYRAKGRAEAAIRASGLRHLILRPSWAYGREDKALNRFRQIAAFSPVVPVPVPAETQRIQPVYVGDIARVTKAAFERDETWNETYEIGSREVLTMREVVATLLEVMGKRRLIVPAPVSLLGPLTAPLKLLPNPPMTPQGLEFATQSGLVDVGPAARAFDVEPLPLVAGVSRYL